MSVAVKSGATLPFGSCAVTYSVKTHNKEVSKYLMILVLRLTRYNILIYV
jgi:hypothetical protein